MKLSESDKSTGFVQVRPRFPVLTVGETDDFCNAGGMIQFVLEKEQVHFFINNDSTRAAGLKISSQLLILADKSKK